jgi:NADPH:quinone reductase-like Zn-dependent oxidoreductase
MAYPDVIAHRSVFALKRALKPGGTYFVVGGSLATLFQVLFLGPLIRRSEGKSLRVLAVRRNQKDLLAITELCEAGKIVPVIDRRYPLSEVPEAARCGARQRESGSRWGTRMFEGVQPIPDSWLLA